MTDFDLKSITMPFGTLRGKIRRALQAHFAAGWDIEVQFPNGSWMIADTPEWAENRVYRAKPTDMGVGPSILDEPLTGLAYASPLNHAGCDTPAHNHPDRHGRQGQVSPKHYSAGSGHAAYDPRLADHHARAILQDLPPPRKRSPCPQAPIAGWSDRVQAHQRLIA